MTEAITTDLRLADLDLQGYSLTERLNGIALMQDPVRADIVKFAAAEIERLTRAVTVTRGALEEIATYAGRGRAGTLIAIAKATLSALEKTHG